MLLAIGVGNSSVCIGAFDGQSLKRRARLPLGKPLDDNWPFDDEVRFQNIVIATVNPPVSDALEKWLRENYSAPLLLARRDFPLPIDIECDEPEKVGTDRLLNAIAAFHLVRRECVVVDLGTALTVDAVSPSGAFVGGAIFPGAKISAEVLHSRTALLPEVWLASAESPIGKSTVDAITAGLYWGLAGAADRLVSEIKNTLGGSPEVIATGGDLPIIKSASRSIDRVAPDLLLDGLRIAFEETLGSK